MNIASIEHQGVPPCVCTLSLQSPQFVWLFGENETPLRGAAPVPFAHCSRTGVNGALSVET